MLTKLNHTPSIPKVKISCAQFPAPFAQGLEYCSPARGTWNIAHTGMLIPEAHEIFVCAAGCLRGVVLTAAEMGAADRFSTIEIKEDNLLDGSMESLIIDGVSDILARLPKTPPAILLYTSCVHHFIGCDLDSVYRTLSEKFPNVRFTDCYMNPIMRKSGLTPDQLMRRQLYSFLVPREKDCKSVAIIGNDLPIDRSSELYNLISDSGFKFNEIHSCKDFDEYLNMASASLFITNIPSAIPAAEELTKRIGGKHIYLSQSFSYDEIISELSVLAKTLNVSLPDYTDEIKNAVLALSDAEKVIGSAHVVIDYTAVYRPLSLARLLLSHGFNVQTVYADSFSGEEKSDFEWLKANFPDLVLSPTVNYKCRKLDRQNFQSSEKTLAIGQKAAYFNQTNYFVNMVEGGGLFGFGGIKRLANLMKEAFLSEKNMPELIQIKGMGCECCL